LPGWGEAPLDLGHGPEAFEAAQSALGCADRHARPAPPTVEVNGARIDMATACFLNNDPDSGTEAIKPLLAQPASLRNVSLVGRLARTRTTLLSPAWAKNHQARQLADEIGHWLATDQAPKRLTTGQS